MVEKESARLSLSTRSLAPFDGCAFARFSCVYRVPGLIEGRPLSLATLYWGVLYLIVAGKGHAGRDRASAQDCVQDRRAVGRTQRNELPPESASDRLELRPRATVRPTYRPTDRAREEGYYIVVCELSLWLNEPVDGAERTDDSRGQLGRPAGQPAGGGQPLILTTSHNLALYHLSNYKRQLVYAMR